MRLAAMYSGGKDSTFAMCAAVQMGHEVPLLVCVVPAVEDSFLFHTPNLDLVPLAAEAMDVGLVTAAGGGSEEGDMDGLRRALEGLDIDGVVTGAAWSDYQWSRIDEVCWDLGLRVVSPMWRKDQDMMAAELLDAGIEAVVVGCCAEGLDASWLGRRLDAAAFEELRGLRDWYGISIMGEGGEYESLTLDSPLHRCPLEMTSWEVCWGRNSGMLRVTGARLG
jgi:diphthine-ammonia ligase